RVEVTRLRRVLRALADVRATKQGFALVPRRTREVVVLARPVEEEHGAVPALLADGESWSSSGLALALGTSQPTPGEDRLPGGRRHIHEVVDAGRLHRLADDQRNGAALHAVLSGRRGGALHHPGGRSRARPGRHRLGIPEVEIP